MKVVVREERRLEEGGRGRTVALLQVQALADEVLRFGRPKEGNKFYLRGIIFTFVISLILVQFNC